MLSFPTWQASLPPSVRPAHIMLGTELDHLQSAEAMTGISTSWGTKGSGNGPPSAICPQPATVAVLPSNVVESVVFVQIQILLKLQDGDIMTIIYDTSLTNLLVVVWVVGDLYNIDKLRCEACLSI